MNIKQTIKHTGIGIATILGVSIMAVAFAFALFGPAILNTKCDTWWFTLLYLPHLSYFGKMVKEDMIDPYRLK